MMASEDLDRLRQNLNVLRLAHVAEHLDSHLREAKRLKLGHAGFMVRVTDAEVLARTERGAQQRISRACFEELVTLDGFLFQKQPAIDRRQIMDLAELGFVDRCESVLLMGPSGVGKSHLATALGVRACESGYRVEYHRAPELFPILHTAMADESLDELLDVLGKPPVLIIDELGAGPRKPDQDFGALFYELVSARHRRGSFIVVSNFAPTEWAKKLGNEPLVTAAVDRLLDGAHVISVPKDAPSFRAERKRGAGRLPRRRLPASVRRYRRR
jgi:DNA replication protein DnaC